MLLTKAEDFTWKPYVPSTSMIFEQMQEVQLIKNEWQICYFYDIEALFVETMKLNECLLQLKAICDYLKAFEDDLTGQMCNNTLVQFKRHMASMQTKERIIKSYNIYNNRNRKRRGLINGVGYALSWLFGTLDAKDAKYYNEQIAQMKENNVKNLELTQRQTLLVEGKYNKITECFFL